jgi:CRISPR-associated endonuclease Csn1
VNISYRLALDVGTNSIGWCAYRLDENNQICSILRAGSRIFGDGRSPKDLASLAADRRLKRQMRRRRDRMVKRCDRFLDQLARFGLMPVDPIERKSLESMDPWLLRAKGLDQELSPYELGRALYHLVRRRGFKSSRKDRGSDETKKETGKIKSAIQHSQLALTEAGKRTIGEWLASLHVDRKAVRARLRSDGEYAIYIDRAMIEQEFDALWTAQQAYYPQLLTDAAFTVLKDTLLFQRKLLPVKPGMCLYEPNEFRARLCSPLQQRFRVLQELNNLRVIEGTEERALTLDERNRLIEELSVFKERSFDQLRKVIGLPKSTRFNLQSEKRKGLKGDLVAASFGSPAVLGASWGAMAPEKQEQLAELVALAESNRTLINALTASPFFFTPHQAEAISTTSLPDDFGSLSRKALLRIVPQLEQDVVTYADAVKLAGYAHHSWFYTGEIRNELPYYGEVLRNYTSPTERAKDEHEKKWGKIPNPTVHIGLRELQKLVNALGKRYGMPRQIVIELTREFGLSGQKRRDIEAEQTKNQKRNEELDARLIEKGQRPSYENRLRLRLWDELVRTSQDAFDRICIYSGHRLSEAMLWSGDIEIDHILPFSSSLHDGIGNKLLCFRQANRDKSNRTPFDAFGHSPGHYDWTEIVERAGRMLPNAKLKLFRPEALKDFLGDNDFLARQINDTAYFARAAKQYLTLVCPINEIWVSTGRLTGMLRARWGLNTLLSDDSRKNRNDHRHHALDAAVIGCCDRSLIKRVADSARRAESLGENRLLESLDAPWPQFREQLGEVLRKVVVSHKPDHGVETSLHNDTNYGWLEGPEKKNGQPLVVHRVPIDSISNADKLAQVVDPALRFAIQAHLGVPFPSGRELKAALLAYSERTGVRRLRISERLAVIPIADRRTQQPYRWVKGDGNYCYEIFRDGKGKWTGTVINNFEANQPDFRNDPRLSQCRASLVMRIHKNDMMIIEEAGVVRVMRVALITEGKVSLCDHLESNADSRERNKADAFSYTRKSPGSLQAFKPSRRGWLASITLATSMIPVSNRDRPTDRNHRGWPLRKCGTRLYGHPVQGRGKGQNSARRCNGSHRQWPRSSCFARTVGATC